MSPRAVSPLPVALFSAAVFLLGCAALAGVYALAVHHLPSADPDQLTLGMIMMAFTGGISVLAGGAGMAAALLGKLG